jgi:hypothetical protein
MIFSFVHFVAVGAKKLHLAVFGVCVSLEVFRIPERRRAVVTFVPPPLAVVVCDFVMAAYLSVNWHDESEIECCLPEVGFGLTFFGANVARKAWSLDHGR